MAPKGLKIGDTFDEKDFKKTFRHVITGFDEQGHYICKCIGAVEEELPFVSTDDDVVEEQPIVEEPKEVKEVKKTAPKKKTTSTKKKTATKKK